MQVRTDWELSAQSAYREVWRDVFTAVTHSYYSLFYSLEKHRFLDPINELHLYALQYVYIPRINRSLQMFKDRWNSHKLCTTGRSLQQMFATSRIEHLDEMEQIDDL